MIHKLRGLFCSMVAFGLLFAPNVWTAPAVDYYIPPPLAPQLSSDGNALYYAASVRNGPPPAEVKLDAAPVALFSPLKAQTKADAGFVRDREVVRSRQVDIDLNLLTSSADLPPGVIAAGRVISLNLFDDANFVAEADRVERTSRGVTWVGRLRGIDLSEVVIVVNGDVVVGNISMPGGRYHIRFAGNGVHEVQQIDQSLFPRDEPFVPIPVQKPDDRSSLQRQDTQADDGSTIDVMVVYSATTRAATGGTAAMQALIDLAVSETNQSYQNSGITQRIRLVHSEEVAYTEGTGGVTSALNCITSPTDGCLDNVHTLRNTYGADLVSFWIENDASYCGMAWFMATVSSSFASSGFSAVKRSCATGYYSFGHEMGHNMGARHDVYVDTGTTPYAYAHGYIYTAAASPWRTVMAYNDGCTAVGKNCTRIPYWSNASNSYGGVAMGNSTADNQQALDNTAYTVANFRSGVSSAVNGVCGPSNGQTLAAAPTTNLCSVGTATAVSGSGPWTWSCLGSNGGSTASCSANKTTGTPGIRVISPNGGETWTTGSTHTVTWTSSSLNPAGSIYIYYWYNNDWQQIAGPLSTSVTSYSWSVPNTPTTSSSIFIGNWINSAWEYSDRSDQSFTITQAGASTPLYFPHVATTNSWQTEIAIINTSSNQVSGTLRGLSNGGLLIETKAVTLSGHGRRQITIANEFTNHTNIGYIIFDADSDAVQGYTKLYQAGKYRAAFPAVKEVNTSNIYIPHIASNADWWTMVSLVNTTSATKQLTITFNNGQSSYITLNANEHRAINIAEEFFNSQPRPDIESAVISNASGVIGLELFGSLGWGSQLEGILLTGNTASTIYYPHVASNNEWWTGIVAYNPSDLACTITITPYDAQGTFLPFSSSAIPPVAGKGKYIGAVAGLGLPAQTAWFKIDSTRPLSGFELFGTTNGEQLAAYAEVGGTGAKAGVFAKIEKNGWTGIAFVNTEAGAASVTLTAYNDNGTAVATQVLPVGGHAKVVNNPEWIFSQNISSATYIAYSSDRNVIGFQLNASSDGMMLDALPGLAGGAGGTITQQTLATTWGVTGSSSSTNTLSGTVIIGSGGTFTYNWVWVNGSTSIPQTGSGTWTLNGSTLTLNFDAGAVYQGTAQGNSTSFSMVCSNGWTLNFTRR